MSLETQIAVVEQEIDSTRSVVDKISNTIEKLTAISNNAKSCASAREDYQKQCCIGIDQGHVGAILKMKRLAEKCDAIRFNKLTNL